MAPGLTLTGKEVQQRSGKGEVIGSGEMSLGGLAEGFGESLEWKECTEQKRGGCSRSGKTVCWKSQKAGRAVELLGLWSTSHNSADSRFASNSVAKVAGKNFARPLP